MIDDISNKVEFKKIKNEIKKIKKTFLRIQNFMKIDDQYL